METMLIFILFVDSPIFLIFLLHHKNSQYSRRGVTKDTTPLIKAEGRKRSATGGQSTQPMHLRDSIWLQDSFIGVGTTGVTGDFDEANDIKSIIEQSVEDIEFFEGTTEKEGEASKNTKGSS